MWCSGCMGRRIRGWVDAWEPFEMHHVLCCRPAIDSQIWMSWWVNDGRWSEHQHLIQLCRRFAQVARLTFGRASQALCEVGDDGAAGEKTQSWYPGADDVALEGCRPVHWCCRWISGLLSAGAKDPIRSAGIPPSMTTWIQRWRRLGPWGIFYAWIDGGRHLKRKNAPWNPELPGWGRFSPDLLGLLPSEVEKADGTPKFFCSGRILSTTCKRRQQCWIIQMWTPYHPLELVWSFRSTNLPSFSLPSLQDSSKVAGPPNHLFIFFPSYPSSNEWGFPIFHSSVSTFFCPTCSKFLPPETPYRPYPSPPRPRDAIPRRGHQPPLALEQQRHQRCAA